MIAWVTDLLEEADRLGEIKDQLDRASISIPLNVAEGNGKYSRKDRCRFFDTAQSSALEFAAALDVLVAKRKFTTDRIQPGKERLQGIVRMLMGLLKSQSARDYGNRSEP